MTNAMERTSPYRFHLSSRRTSCAAPVLVTDHLGWKCPAAESLCLGGPAAHVCRHWAEKTCTLAEQYVRKAFPTEERLSIAKRPPSGSIPLLMALAGSDTEDHVATMRLAEALFREKIPGVSTALIHSGELRSLAYANRKIMEKLRNAASASDCKADSQVDADDLNDPDFEDEEPEELPIPSSFLELRGKDGAGCIPLTVLLFEGVDAAPKDVLRQVLCFWHAQCLEDGAPLLIFFGSGPWQFVKIQSR